jgi:hypothetical protein
MWLGIALKQKPVFCQNSSICTLNTTLLQKQPVLKHNAFVSTIKFADDDAV